MSQSKKNIIAAIGRETEIKLFYSISAVVYVVESIKEAKIALEAACSKDIKYIFVSDDFLKGLIADRDFDLMTQSHLVSALPAVNGKTEFFSQHIDTLFKNAAGIDLSGEQCGK